MGTIKNIKPEENGVSITIKVTKDEYKNLKHEHNVALFPISDESFETELTIGTIGNSYRVNLPKKLLKKHEIEDLNSKGKARVVNSFHDKYLIVRISESKKGIPQFKE